MCAQLLDAVRPLPQYRVLTVNALNINNAGAYIYQELGYALSWGAELIASSRKQATPSKN